MGHQTSHPIRQRLTQALDAILGSKAVFPFFSDLPVATADENALRDWVLRHHVRYGLDPAWILTGSGQAPFPQQDNLPPSVPVFSMTSIDQRTGRWSPLIRERIVLPPSLLSPSRFVVRQEDRSMEPRLRLGAYLVVETEHVTVPVRQAAETAPGQGDLFAVDLVGEGLVIRLARRDVQTDSLRLTALAPTTPPLRLPLAETGHRLLGRVVWVAQLL